VKAGCLAAFFPQRALTSQRRTSVDSPGEPWDGLLRGTVQTTAIVRGQPDDVAVRIRSGFDRRMQALPPDGPNRHPVPGDRHRVHHLRQILAVVLGVPERPRPRLGGAAVLVVGDRVGQLEVVVGGLGLPLGGGGVHEHDVQIHLRPLLDKLIQRNDPASGGRAAAQARHRFGDQRAAGC
jgi:hypothetical protein